MNTEIKAITVNGIKYIEASIAMEKIIVKDYVIVRTYSAGVHAGELVRETGKRLS